MSLSCDACGHNNEAEANFCSSCGAGLHQEETTLAYAIPDAGGEETADGLRRDGNYGVLEVLSGPKKGSRFALSEQTTSAGRHPDSEIFLDDVTVSRRHAVIERIEDHYQVRDAGSLNGTYLNRERVDDAILTDGDEVQVGKFKLVFVAPAQTGRSTPVAKEDD